MQRNIAGSRCKVSIIVSASIPLASFIALITGRLCKSLGFFFQGAFKVSSILPRTSSFSCPLITSSLNSTILSDRGCSLLSECCLATSFYQRTANHVFFIWFSICATYHTLSVSSEEPWSQVNCISETTFCFQMMKQRRKMSISISSRNLTFLIRNLRITILSQFDTTFLFFQTIILSCLNWKNSLISRNKTRLFSS